MAAKKKAPAVPAVCAELQGLQRQRAVVIKSRLMQANRLEAVVAGTLGYRSGLKEAERRAKYREAAAVIRAVAKGQGDSPLGPIIVATLDGLAAFDGLRTRLEKEMLRLAALLPAAGWVEAPQQRGFGLLGLATVVGEAGDLAGYPEVAKLWRRMCCAPWTHAGATQMGQTWRAGRAGRLPAEEWENYGYSPRRRSIAYLIGEAIMKQNGGDGSPATDQSHAADCDAAEGEGEGEAVPVTEGAAAAPRLCGPYRLRYDEAKAKAALAHPDWSKLRRHRHAMLLATKLLLKNLWLEWHGHPPHPRRAWMEAA
jgi:hypothetical protein